MSNLEYLLKALEPQTSQSALNWLELSCQSLKSSSDPVNDLSMFTTMTGRKVGYSTLEDKTAGIVTPSGMLPILNWTTADAARVILILTAIDSFPDNTVELINTDYRFGDEFERASITKSLALYPFPESLKPIALETGRANSPLLFTSLALNNPYPASQYTEHEFNQMILKALFTGKEIASVIGLQSRANKELSRMCEDYIEERQLAGRTIPVDIWLALGKHASQHSVDLLLEHVTDSDPDHRYFSLLALVTTRPIHEKTLEIIRERSTLETEENILELIQNNTFNS